MVVLVSLQMVELTHTDLNIITRSVYFILYILEVYLAILLSVSCLLWLLVSCLPAAVVSPLSFTLCLPLTYYSVTICPWCPRSPPSPSLTLPLSLWDSRWRLWPSSVFCSGSPERPVAFWTAHSSAPHISYKMQAPFFSLKKGKLWNAHFLNICIEMSITSGYYNLRLFVTYRLHCNVLYDILFAVFWCWTNYLG